MFPAHAGVIPEEVFSYDDNGNDDSFNGGEYSDGGSALSASDQAQITPVFPAHAGVIPYRMCQEDQALGVPRACGGGGG